jgi:hypothetical protein
MQHLLLGAALRGGQTLAPPALAEAVRSGMPSYLAPSYPSRLAQLWLRLVDGGLEASLDPLSEAHLIKTVDLKSLPLIIDWVEGIPRRGEVVLNPPQTAFLALVPEQVDVTVPDGSRYRLKNKGPTIKPPPRCFVVMGFGMQTDFATGRKLDLDKSYRLLIKPAVAEAGMECVRADEIRRPDLIDIPMYRELLMSDYVVADLSTANANALYALGIRHGLRPRGTVVISEKLLPYPFNTQHTTIMSYTHLGDAIDYDEIIRFRRALSDKLRVLRMDTELDSPVYIFLKNLVPPVAEASRVLETPAAAPTSGAAAVGAKPVPPSPTLAAVIQEGEKAIAGSQFAAAKTFFGTALRSASSDSDMKGAIAHDPYLIQRLVLATYKAKQPNQLEALHEAKKLLEGLDPQDSNDPETVGLAGAIEKRLFEEGQGLEHLTAAIRYYARGYYLRNDWYNAINFAYLLNVRANSALDKTDSERVADLVWASRIRSEVIKLCQRDLAAIAERQAQPSDGGEKLRSELQARDQEQKFWCLATSAEASFGLGDFKKYEQTRADAVAASHATWMVETVDGQIDKLKSLLTRYGHLLDPPWRALSTGERGRQRRRPARTRT